MGLLLRGHPETREHDGGGTSAVGRLADHSTERSSPCRGLPAVTPSTGHLPLLRTTFPGTSTIRAIAGQDLRALFAERRIPTGTAYTVHSGAMREIIIGAGAIGSAIGGLLTEAGHRPVLVGRGDHLEAMRRDGLRGAGGGAPADR
jgi:hypothetical protein